MILRDTRFGRWVRSHARLHAFVHATWCHALNGISKKRMGSYTSQGASKPPPPPPPPSLSLALVQGNAYPNLTTGAITEEIAFAAAGGDYPYMYSLTWSDGVNMSNAMGTFMRIFPAGAKISVFGTCVVTDRSGDTASAALRVSLLQ